MKRPANPTIFKLLNPQKKVGLFNRSLVQQRQQNPFLLTPLNENDYFNSLTMSLISPQRDPYSQRFLAPILEFAKKSDSEKANERISEWQDDVKKYLATHTWDVMLPDLNKTFNATEGEEQDALKVKEPDFLHELLSEELLKEAKSIMEDYPEVKEKVQQFLKAVAQSNIERVKNDLRKLPSRLDWGKERFESDERYKKAMEEFTEGYREIYEQFRGRKNKLLSKKKYNIESIARKLMRGETPEKTPLKELDKYSLEELLAYKELFDIPSPFAFGTSPSTSKFLRVFYPALSLTSKFVTGLPNLTRNLSEIDGTRITFLNDVDSFVTDPEGRVHDEGFSRVLLETPGWQATKHIFRYVGDLMRHNDELRVAREVVKGDQKKNKTATDEDVQRMLQKAKDEVEYIDRLIRKKQKSGEGQLMRLADAASTPKIPIRPIFNGNLFV